MKILQLSNFRRSMSFHPDRPVCQVFIAPIRAALHLQNKSLLFKFLTHTNSHCVPLADQNSSVKSKMGKTEWNP